VSEKTRVERFEDLVAWQRSRAMTGTIYRLTRVRIMPLDPPLARQMQRAAVSTMANIAEGFERQRLGEFHQFFSIAKASCGECRSHMYAALEAGYIDDSELADLLAEAEEVGRIIGGLRAAVARRQQNNSSNRR
jgi:four helix bundle protein